MGVSSQPLAILWPKGTQDAEGRRLRDHVPDFFVRLSNGDGRLVDVRRPDKAETHQFALTKALCDKIGWRYEVFTGLDEQVAHALTWLGGYRMDRYAPSSPEVAQHLVEAFTPATSLRAGVARAARSSGVQKDLVQANVLNLLFTGMLCTDLSQPLTMDSEVGAGMAVTR